MRSLNRRAAEFALRHLFLAEPEDGRPVASISIAELAHLFCQREHGDQYDEEWACQRHRQAMVIGCAKAIADGRFNGEMARKGKVFVRLTPEGVLLPSSWSTPPHWWGEKPKLIQWAVREQL